jgi:gas vesicle protein
MRDYDYDDDEQPYVVIEHRSGGVGGFLIGAAVGAGIALLMAPRSGVETRRGIRRSAERVRDAAQRAAQDVTDNVVDTFQDARRRVEEQIDTAREAIELRTRQVTSAVEAGRAAAQEARLDLERRLAQTKAAYRAAPETDRPVRGRQRG